MWFEQQAKERAASSKRLQIWTNIPIFIKNLWNNSDDRKSGHTVFIPLYRGCIVKNKLPSEIYIYPSHQNTAANVDKKNIKFEDL